MSDSRPRSEPEQPKDTSRDVPYEPSREDLGPPFYLTLTVGQGVDDRTVEAAGENPEARI